MFHSVSLWAQQRRGEKLDQIERWMDGWMDGPSSSPYALPPPYPPSSIWECVASARERRGGEGPACRPVRFGGDGTDKCHAVLPQERGTRFGGGALLGGEGF